MKNYCISFLMLLLLVACEPNRSEPLEWLSEDGRVKLIITAKQDTWADPWEPNVQIFVDDKLLSTQPALPVFASVIDESTVKIQWSKGEVGKITFLQRDDTEKEFILPRLNY